MSDILDQEGISFDSARMASTHPTTTPSAIETQKIDMESAPGNQTAIAPVDASLLQPPAQDAPRQRNGGAIPPPPDPQQISQAMSGAGNEGSAAAGAAPPQPQADILDMEGITAPQQRAYSAFNGGVSVSPDAQHTPETAPVGQYAADQAQQNYNLGLKRFSPQQLNSFAKNPVSIAEAIQNQEDWPDVPKLLEKQRDGFTLDDNQKNRLNEYIDKQLSNNLRGFNWGGNKAIIGQPVQAALIDAVNQMNGGKAADTSEPVKPANYLNGNVIIPKPYTPQVGEKPLNDYMAVTDKGQQLMAQAKEKPATTAMKNLSYDELPADLKKALYDSMVIHNPNARITDLQKQQGYHMALDALGEEGAADMLHWYSGIQHTFANPMTYEEHVNAQYQGQMFPFSEDPAGKVRFDPRAGLISPLFVPGDIETGNIQPQQVEEEGRGMAANLALMEFGNKAGAAIEARTGTKAPEATQEAPKTVDDYLGALTPSKDNAMVNAGIVSVDGAKSAATAQAETILQAKGLPPDMARETVANMTATQKDNFVANNQPPIEGTVPTLSSETAIPGHIAKDIETNGATVEPNKQFQIGSDGQGGFTAVDGEGRVLVEDDNGLFSWSKNQNKASSFASKEDVSNGIEAAHQGEADTKTLKNQSALADKYGKMADNGEISIDLYKRILSKIYGHDKDLLPDEPPPTGNPDSDLIKSQNAAVNAANPPVVADAQSGFNRMFKKFKDEMLPSLYAELFNDIQPIESLTKTAREGGADVPVGQDTKLVASFAKSTPAWIERNWTSNTTEFDAAGNQVVTGKGLKAIRDEFDAMLQKIEGDWKARQADMDAYRQARTFLEDKEKNLSNVSNDDLTRSTVDLARLADKYGESFKLFEPFGKQEVAWNNRILHNLVSSGLKTQEWYDHTVGQRQWYSPTQRVVDEEFPDLVASRKIGLDVTPSRIGALMQRKGSDLALKNTFQSQLRNSAIILQKSAHNKLRADIAKFAEFYPDEVKVKAPAVIREAVQHSFDPKLRTKLEQLVEFLGGEVKRLEVGEKGPLKKSHLGAYEPASKDIYLKAGTTEGTLTHEAGHMLDYVLGLKKELLGDKGIKAELQKLAEDRLRAEINLQKNAEGMTEFAEKLERAPKGFMKYLKNDDEVLANFFDAWVNSPEQAKATAPKAVAAFEKLIDANPQLAMLRDVRPSTSRDVETIQRELLDQRGPKGSVPFYQNGRRMYLELDKELQKAFSTMSPMEIGMVERLLGGILGTSTKLLKAGATSLPEFMAKHFYRAVFTSFLNNPGEKGMIGFMRHVGVNLPKGIFAVLSKNELYKEWASSSGALRTFMDLNDKALSKVQVEMFDKGNMGSYLNPVNWAKVAVKAYKTTKEISDYAPRIAVFKSMKAKGASDLEAGLASLEATGNYIRHGSLVARINKSAPFFNDMVQGGDRFIRSQMRHPAAFLTKAISTVMIPQMMITGYYLYAADDETRHEYLNIPDFDRSIAMTVKIGDTWKKLPRAFAPGFVYGALTEKLMVWLYSQSHDDAPKMKDFWLRTLGEAATSVSPAFDWTRAITPLFKSWMESTMNYSLFMRRPLFTGDMTKTAPTDQTNQYTTETAKMVGKLFDISPINVDNTVYDMSGKAGRYAMQLTDMAINSARRAQGQPVNEREARPADSPLYGGLVMDVPRGTSAESYQEFLGNLHEAQQAHNHVTQLKGPDIGTFTKENHQLLAAYGHINAVNSQINELQKQIRDTNKDTNLAGHDKTTKINHLQDTIGRIVEGANKAYRATTGGNK